MPVQQIITPFILEKADKLYRRQEFTHREALDKLNQELGQSKLKCIRLNNLLFLAIALNLLFALDVLIAVSPF